MNKNILLALALAAVLSTVGCKKTSNEDIYIDETIIMTEETSVVGENNQNMNTEPEKSNDVEKDADDELDKDDKTVTEDIYEEVESVSEVDPSILEVDYVKSMPIDDPELMSKMKDYLEPFYYNMYFGDKDYSETGITEEDMVKFAVSYVNQYEHQGLKFDTKTFELYIPDERVEQLVEKYFGAKLSGHHALDEEKIGYNGGYYLMPASDRGWNDEMVIEDITVAGDFAYEVRFTIKDIEDQPVQSYSTTLEIRNNRFVMTNYKFIELQ